ncbi:MAG: hypothetical protein R3F29_11940 [Planctomycetota bacterium]
MFGAALLLSLATAPAVQQPETAAPEPIAALCERFAGFDQDGDGRPELATVKVLHEAGASGPQVLVLVEPRLLAGDADGRPFALASRVRRLVDDLGGEGRRATALLVQLAPCDRHQDGRYVLALRELLRAFAARAPLEAALLVGHFPDALIVRTCNWRRRDDVVLRRGQPDQAVHKGAHWLRRVPEDVAHRADLVLGDLDGDWASVYVQPRTRLETISAVFAGPVPERSGSCVDFERGGVEFEDFFLVSDGKCEVAEVLGVTGSVVGHTVLLDDRSADHECSAADRTRPNVLAHPEVLVSRIDARGTAMVPRDDVVGVDGEHLLDADGKPQAVRFASAAAAPKWNALWRHDEALERRLLADYLDRNHAYRTGAAEVAWRPTSLACGLGSGFREISRAGRDWLPAAPASDVHGEPSLLSVTAWLELPAVLRTLRAHSDSWGSVFGKPDIAALEQAVGGPSWSWTLRGDRLEPSLRAACGGGKLDWFLLHTLWQNGRVAAPPSFYHHTGCEGISPPGWSRRPYDHPGYGVRQGAEALLLFGNGLALVGRAKVFYDEPRGFAAALARGETFGAAWARYFEVESQAASWGEVGGDIGRKRSYFWSVLGDVTLRLRPPQ